MRIILAIGGLVSYALGFMVLVVSASAIHEIEAYVLFVNGTCALGFAAVIEAVSSRKTIPPEPAGKVSELDVG